MEICYGIVQASLPKIYLQAEIGKEVCSEQWLSDVSYYENPLEFPSQAQVERQRALAVS